MLQAPFCFRWFLGRGLLKGWPLAKREPKTKRGTNNYMYPPSHKHWWNNKLLMFTFFYGEAFCGGPGTFDCRKLPWMSFLRKLWFSSGRLIGSSFILKPSPSLCVTSYFVALKNIHSRSFNSSPAHKVSIPKRKYYILFQPSIFHGRNKHQGCILSSIKSSKRKTWKSRVVFF